jgi:hypothetical protein
MTTVLLAIVCYGCICYKYSSPAGSCSIDSFLITESELPENNWQSSGPPSADQAPSRVEAEKIGTSFFTTSQGGIMQTVYRFWDMDNAVKYYEEDVIGWYTQQKHESEWLTPEDLLDLPIKADIYELRCSNSIYSGAEQCRFFARYANYVIEMSTTTLAIDHEQLVRLFVDIDNHILYCLDNKR